MIHFQRNHKKHNHYFLIYASQLDNKKKNLINESYVLSY